MSSTRSFVCVPSSSLLPFCLFTSVIYPLCLSSSPSTSSQSPPTPAPSFPHEHSHTKKIIYPPQRPLPSPPAPPTPVWLCISMPAEHVNLSRRYRRLLVKLSSDSLQQDDHRMPVARRIRTVVTISNGGSNVLLCSHLLHCIQKRRFLHGSMAATKGTLTQIQLAGLVRHY